MVKKLEIPLKCDDVDNFGAVLNCAVRYCIGRSTYMPELVTSWIMHNCNNKLTYKTIWCMKQDIDKSAKYIQLGQECDVKTWKNFREWLDTQEELKV